jgi:hypothetical protein
MGASLLAIAVEHSTSFRIDYFPFAHKKGRFFMKTAYPK